MNKQVALVGGHPRTRGMVPWDDKAVDIFVWNDGAMRAPRVTAALEIHSEQSILDPEYLEWLKQPKKFPVYMQAADPGVPGSVAYPLEDALAIAPGVSMFTCSAAWMMALAILKGYRTIHLYGMEAENHTEYIHQGEALAFWVGLARGRGIDVQLHCLDRVFQTPLYGYETEGIMHMKLDFAERVLLLGLLPQTGDILTVRTLRDIRNRLEFSAQEVTEWNVQVVDGGDRLQWKQGDTSKDFEFQEFERRVLLDALTRASDAKAMPLDLLDVYEALITTQ